jgi:hypothetical protein
MVKVPILVTLFLTHLVTNNAEGRAHNIIDPQVHRILQKTGTANVFVTLIENPSNITDVANRRNFKDDSEKWKEVSDRLGVLAANSQKDVLAYLAGNPWGFKSSQSFWLT